MTRRSLFPILLLPLPTMLASRANGDPRLEKLYGQFIAPCCWAESLLLHNSPIADQMRGEIRKWVAEGKTDEQIKAIFVDRYTMRVLSLPEGVRLQWLVWTPIAAITAGLAALLIAVKRLSRSNVTTAPPSALASLPDLDPDWEDVH